MKKINLFLVACLFTTSTAAQAPYDWVVLDANVVSIEVTYMPLTIMFTTDKSAGSCPAGTFLRWTASGADINIQQGNGKSVFATLMAAKLSATTIRMYGLNAGCEVKFLYLG